ncbi:glycosyl hydrolase [bacterium]|nr:glycosyl hydrolase [bacterium]
MRRTLTALLSAVLLAAATATAVQTTPEKSDVNAGTFSGLTWRNIGPAFTSGRIADFAVNPDNHSEYYVAVASGHIWKTTNHGITFSPVFDNYGVYAVGCLAMDPSNHNVVWAGTGENNSQRALGYGDGVYKTVDGGRSWKNMGLKTSRQIGKIIVDPRDGDVVYVACEGSVWGPGGERGLYKTTDGGATWKAVLEISEHTGVSDMVMDPRDPDVIYAASHQRRRHVFTKIDGGPETAVYKTTDGGATWRELKSGLPGGDKGAIGLALSPVNPDVIYAIIEAQGESGGFFRSTNRGESWSRMSDMVAGSPQYYNEIFCDPKDVDKVYSMDTVAKVSEDGGKTWRAIGNNARHVDDHALWINPCDTGQMIIGGDGGIYETYDAGSHWRHIPNLPVIQFYRVAVDNTKPFYYVYGGTQDNNSLGGPSRTICSEGILNDDWFVTNGGDGFWAAIDPENPDIVYAESQYGYMVRYDKQSGESISIQPQPRKGEDTYKWNWDTPLFVSPHKASRIYVAANKVFRSDDRGNTWQVISDDLTRQIDRNTLEVMGRVWSVDAVAKNASTSLFGTIVSLAESPVQEDLIFAGTDDGLIRITEDQKTWRKVEKFPGLPEMTYVSDICPSRFDADIVFATFNNHKRDDFAPYIYKSTDKGRSWKRIGEGLPENGPVHTIEQDFVNPDLLFLGTEFAFYYSVDGGANWIKFTSGLPAISVKDIALHKGENDIVIATFGRGFYVLDDYTPLREYAPELLKKDAHLFTVTDALQFIPRRGKGGQGSTFYAADNPPVAAVFSLYLKDTPKTLKQMRQEKEKQLRKEDKPIPYPSWDELRAEEQEEKPYLLFTIADESGGVVRKLAESPRKGVARYTWDLRAAGTRAVRVSGGEFNPMSTGSAGPLVMPGTYTVAVSQCVRGEMTELVAPTPFNVVPLHNTTLPAPDRAALFAFQQKAAELYRVVDGCISAAGDLQERLASIRQAAHATPDAPADIMKKAKALEDELGAMLIVFNGDPIISRNNENPPTSISSRLRTLAYTHYSSLSEITQTETDAYQIIKDEFGEYYDRLKEMIEADAPALEKALDAARAPWTPGRLPEFEK